jgi:hypothetical protein
MQSAASEADQVPASAQRGDLVHDRTALGMEESHARRSQRTLQPILADNNPMVARRERRARDIEGLVGLGLPGRRMLAKPGRRGNLEAFSLPVTPEPP